MKKIGHLRLIIQILSLILFNLGVISAMETGVVAPAFYCHGCPAASFGCPIGVLQNFAVDRTLPYYAIGSLGLFGLVLGRFWCGWVCPFGALQDLIIRLRRNRDVINLPPFPWLKYLSLLGILLAAGLLAEAAFCKVCPSGSLFAAIPHELFPSESAPGDVILFQPSDEPDIGTFFYVHLATLAVSLVLFVVIARFWCRYLCPLGAIFGAFNRVSVLKIRLDGSKCTGCKRCLSNCPAGFTEVESIGSSSDCIQCGKCINSCPTNALSISASLRA
ncbi:MAG: 4Fe-4S binding protein [Dehalococcoidia bacterium]